MAGMAIEDAAIAGHDDDVCGAVSESGVAMAAATRGDANDLAGVIDDLEHFAVGGRHYGLFPVLVLAGGEQDALLVVGQQDRFV